MSEFNLPLVCSYTVSMARAFILKSSSSQSVMNWEMLEAVELFRPGSNYEKIHLLNSSFALSLN